MTKKIMFLLSFTLVNIYAVNFNKIEITGDVTYELEETLKDGDTSDGEQEEAAHDIDVDLKFAYPFSKQAEFAIQVDDEGDKDANANALELEIDQVYMNYKLKDMQAQFGLQEISAPFLYERNGDGLLFVRSFGTNALAVGYFIDNSFSKSDEVMLAAVVGEKNTINYSLWYTKIEDSSETSTDYGSDATQLAIYKQQNTMKFGVSYTTLTSGDTTSRTLTDDQMQTVIYLNNTDKSIRYEIAYIMTGKHGGNVALDEETDSEANFSLDEVGANDVVDGKVYYIELIKYFANTAIEIKYLNGDGTTSAEEMYLGYNLKLDDDLYCYISGNKWEKENESDSEKVEVGFNISF